MVEVLLKALEVAWKGMLAIFVAIGIIFLAIIIMNTVNKKVENKNRK